MIVGTRMLNGTIAHFDVPGNDYKQACNEVMWELGVECGIHTPILALIPDCGRDLKKSIVAHRVTRKDVLQGALDALIAMKESLGKPIIPVVPDEDPPKDMA